MNFLDVYEHYDLVLLTGNAVKTQISKKRRAFHAEYKKIFYYHVNKILEDILDIFICMEIVYEVYKVETFHLVTGGNVLIPNDKTLKRNRKICYNNLYYKM